MRTATRLALLVFVASLAQCADEQAPSFSVFLETNAQKAHAPFVLEAMVDFSRDELDETAFVLRWDYGDGSTRQGGTRTQYTYQDAGEYVLRVEVLHPDGRKGARTQTISVLDSVDLQISNVEARPRQLLGGESLSAIFSLRNNAPQQVELPFEVWVFVTSNKNVDSADLDELIVLHRELVSTLPAKGSEGSVRDMAFTLRLPESLASGEYWLGAIADPNAALGESDELNNLALDPSPLLLRNPSTDGPDLVVLELAVQPKRSRILSSMTLQFAIANQGLSPALDVEYAVFLSEDDVFDPDADLELLSATLSAISTGQRIDVGPVYVPVLPAISRPGWYHVFVVVDPHGRVHERNENNNVATTPQPIELTDEPILDADIIVTDFALSPSQTYLGGTVSSVLTVANQGNQATGSFICTIYLSEDELFELERDIPLSSINVFELGGRSQLELEAIVPIPKSLFAGPYFPFVFCDASGVVIEYDEENNLQRAREPLTIFVAAEFDLYPASLRVEPSLELVDGEPAKLLSEICNAGSTGSGPNLMRIHLSLDAILSSDDVLLVEAVVPGLSPNTCVLLEHDIQPQCTPWKNRYVLLVEVDAQRMLSETNEDNNILVLSGLVIDGPRCACVADAFEPNNFSEAPATLGAGRIEATLCDGDSDWYLVQLEAGQSLRATLQHEPSLGELNLLLFGPQREKLDETAQSDGREQVEVFLVEPSGDYLLQVRAASPAQVNAYSLELELLEPVLGWPELVLGKLRLPPQVIASNTPFQLGLVVSNLGDVAAPPFRVGLFSNQDVVDSSAPLLAEELLQLGPRSSRNLQFEVVLPNDSPAALRIGAVADWLEQVAESDETNNTAISDWIQVDNGCNDQLEPNDSFETAVSIQAQTLWPAPNPNYTELVVCKDNPDFYRVSALSGTRLEFVAEHQAALGDLDLVLYDSTGRELSSARSNQNRESIALELVLGAQDFVLEVQQHPSPFNSDRSDYELTVTMVPVAPNLLCNDLFEPNDEFSRATGLISAAAGTQTAAICPSDDADFYDVFLPAGSSLELRIADSSRFLRASLYDPNRSFVQTLLDPLGSRLRYTAPLSGRYTVKVFSAAGAAREEPYRLELSGLDGFDLTPSALQLSTSVVMAGEALTAQVQIVNLGSQATPPFELWYLLSSDPSIQTTDTLLASVHSASLGPGEFLTFSTKLFVPPATPAGQVWLGVLVDPLQSLSELDELNNELGMPLHIVAACLDDAFEAPADNNHPSRATDLAAHAPVLASICPADEDWFVLDTSTAQGLRLELLFSSALGDLDLYAYDPQLQLLAAAQSDDDDELLMLSTPLPQSIFVRVRGFGASVQNHYQLDYSVD